MNLKEEKQIVLQELVNVMNNGLTNEEKLTSELLGELKEKIEELIKNDF
jgi:hypothetical protein